MIAKFDIKEITFQKSFERLIDFAQSNGFSKSWNNVYIVEDVTTVRLFDENKKAEIPKSALVEFSKYKKYFDEVLLKQGYSWINLSLLGILNGDLIITIEIPNYNNKLEFTHVNISHSNLQKLSQDLSSYYKIVD